MLVAGVDSSTQSTKVVLCRAEDGQVVGLGSAPHPAGTECDPAGMVDGAAASRRRLAHPGRRRGRWQASSTG